MFDTTHDYVLIAIALLYSMVFFARVVLSTRGGPSGKLWLNMPAWIASACLLVAVFW